MLPAVGVIVIMLCFLCMWWHIPAFRNALKRRCCHCLGGYEGIVEEQRNHFENTKTINVDVRDRSQTVDKNDILSFIVWKG